MNATDAAQDLLHSGQASDAVALLNAHLSEADASEHSQLRARLLMTAAHDQQGALEAAIDAADRAIALAQRLSDAAAEAEALCLRAGACHKLGLSREAFDNATAGLAQARTLGNARVEALALRQMSNQVLNNGQEQEARDLLEQSLAVARRTGHWLQQAYAVANLADAYIVEGNHARARQLVAEYAGLARARGSVRLLAYAHLDEVSMLRAEGRADEAVRVIDSEQHRSLLSGNDDLALDTETALYEIHKAAGRFEAALAHHEKVARIDAARLTRRAEQQLSMVMARIELEQLHRAAHEDPLTGIGNRRAADAALERASNKPLHIALVDIDHFKSINDTHGHATGDAVLAAIGGLMRQSVRSRDQVFRYGGEEFLLILNETSAEGAWEVCERQRLAIAQHDWHAIAPGLAVTASFGLAQQSEGEAPAALVGRADKALYAAKRAGRNRIAKA